MSVILENLGQIILMLILLFCSGFFSGTETAFFNLSRRESIAMKGSKNQFARLAFTLLQSPKSLLSALLFGNMIVNVLYFAISSSLSITFGRSLGATAAFLYGGVSFMLLVILGEMIPKSIAFSNSKRFAITAALPCYLIVKTSIPFLKILELLIIDPAIKLLAPSKNKKLNIGISHIKMLIESSRKKGSITADQNRLLSEVLELGFLKVRHVMRPRVDIVIADIETPTDEALEMMLKNSIKKLPLFEENIDNVLGIVLLRDVILNPKKKLRDLMRSTTFVPEQKTVESLLEFFKNEKKDLAMVVDEYGGIAGLITMKDVIAELLGPKNPEDGADRISQIGPMKYRLSGNLPVHDWADAFGLSVSHAPYSTLGGLVTNILGKIPQPNDIARMKNLEFKVESVKNYRIESLTLKVLTAGDK